ncbi:hypothetical protein JCM10207_000839 [Rhodosporidiobolus poonsookiae]
MASTSNTAPPRKAARPPPILQARDKADKSYRVRRGNILRSLGQSCARNGSQFAILWVSPSADHTEIFTSEAFRRQAREWLGPDIQNQARHLVRRLQTARETRTQQGLEGSSAGAVYDVDGEAVEIGLDSEEADDGEGDLRTPIDAFSPRPPGGANYDDFLPAPTRAAGPASASSPGLSASLPPPRGGRSNTHLSSQQPSPAPSPSSHASPANAPSPFVASPGITVAPSPRPRSPFVSWSFTPVELPGWYERRLGDLTHKNDKHVAKAWIKVIEPHKQALYPYREGDGLKPEWWPLHIRHKEPDHLGKPERISLLAHLVRNSPTSVDELEQATRNLGTNVIPEEKLAILAEIYTVAKAEREAIQQSSTGTFESITVAIPTQFFKQEEDAASPEIRQHNTRHRTRRSVGGNGKSSENLAPPPQQHQQHTPRSGRVSPYPLSRSQSASDMPGPGASPVRSPAPSVSTGNGPGSAMTRSQSFAGPVNGAGKPRNARQNGRHSLGEADLLDPANGASVLQGSMGDFQPSLQATPYRQSPKPTITPRQGQGSPLAASMSRSFSASAVHSSGGGSVTKKSAAMIDDSVASPAMIRSRSKLSQQHFDQMGLGSVKLQPSGAKGRPPPPQSPAPSQGPPHGHPPGQPIFVQQQHGAHPHAPQHPMQQQQPQFHPQRPPLHHAHTQPVPHGHPSQRVPPAHHRPPPPHHPSHQPQQVLVYPAHGPPSAPALSRQGSAQGLALHPAHQASLAQQNPHGHPHHPTQVQVQVNVHAGHGLPPDFEAQQHPQLVQAHAQAQMLQHHQHQQQQHHAQMQGSPYVNGGGNGYPTPTTATYASPHFAAAASSTGASPYLGGAPEHSPHPQAHHQHHPQQHFLPSHLGSASGTPAIGSVGDAYLVPSHLAGDLSSAGASPLPLGEYLAEPPASAGSGSGLYGTSPLLGAGSSSFVGGDGQEDLSAYMQQLDALSAQQQAQQGGYAHSQNHTPAPGGGGGAYEDPSLGLGIGLGGLGTPDALGVGMMLEPGYYGEEPGGYGAVGA